MIEEKVNPFGPEVADARDEVRAELDKQHPPMPFGASDADRRMRLAFRSDAAVRLAAVARVEADRFHAERDVAIEDRDKARAERDAARSDALQAFEGRDRAIKGRNHFKEKWGIANHDAEHWWRKAIARRDEIRKLKKTVETLRNEAEEAKSGARTTIEHLRSADEAREHAEAHARDLEIELEAAKVEQDAARVERDRFETLLHDARRGWMLPPPRKNGKGHIAGTILPLPPAPLRRPITEQQRTLLDKLDKLGSVYVNKILDLALTEAERSVEEVETLDVPATRAFEPERDDDGIERTTPDPDGVLGETPAWAAWESALTEKADAINGRLNDGGVLP